MVEDLKKALQALPGLYIQFKITPIQNQVGRLSGWAREACVLLFFLNFCSQILKNRILESIKQPS